MFPIARARHAAAVGTLLTALTLTACADTSLPTGPTATPGRTASQGVNAGGVNGGGAGGGGGGSVTPPATGPCATVAVKNTTGYYKIWAAIWSQYSLTNTCGVGVNVRFTYFNTLTNQVDFTAGAYAGSGTIDEDWAAFSTPYVVTVEITDVYGNLVSSQSETVTTPKPKGGTSGV